MHRRSRASCAATRPRSTNRGYRATAAQWKAEIAAKRPKQAKLVTNPRLREYVQDRLAGNVRRPDGTIVPGPETPPWKGLKKRPIAKTDGGPRHGARSRSLIV